MYAILGTSRHICVGPTAVVSLLAHAQYTSFYNSETQPEQYLQLATTATFYSGIIQLGMGLFR